jgi:hypothetical protein
MTASGLNRRRSETNYGRGIKPRPFLLVCDEKRYFCYKLFNNRPLSGRRRGGLVMYFNDMTFKLVRLIYIKLNTQYEKQLCNMF